MTESEFDWAFYIKAYPDLKDMTKEKALSHYKKFGKVEGRLSCAKSLPEDFDWLAYITFNPDLRVLKNMENAIAHYHKYGCNENRILSVKDYISKNMKYEILGDYKGDFEQILKNEAEAFKKITHFHLKKR